APAAPPGPHRRRRAPARRCPPPAPPGSPCVAHPARTHRPPLSRRAVPIVHAAGWADGAARPVAARHGRWRRRPRSPVDVRTYERSVPYTSCLAESGATSSPRPPTFPFTFHTVACQRYVHGTPQDRIGPPLDRHRPQRQG